MRGSEVLERAHEVAPAGSDAARSLAILASDQEKSLSERGHEVAPAHSEVPRATPRRRSRLCRIETPKTGQERRTAATT